MLNTLALSLVVLVPAQAAPEVDPIVVTTAFTVPGHGSLLLEVPQSWKHKVTKNKQLGSVNITLMPRNNKDLQLLITAFASPRAADLADPDVLQRLVQTAMKAAEPTAVDGSLKLYRIRADKGLAYMFSATDRAPAKGEFEYLLQGTLVIESTLIVSFTILSHQENSASVQDALSILKTAGFEAQ